MKKIVFKGTVQVIDTSGNQPRNLASERVDLEFSDIAEYSFREITVPQGAVDFDIEFGNVSNVIFAWILSSVEISITSNVQGTPDPPIGKHFAFTGSPAKYIENIQADNPNAVDAKVFIVIGGVA